MLYKLRKLLIGNKGFTLIELMAVLIILGVVLAIGVPRYMKFQAQAEYDADVARIKSLAKQAEMYAVRNDDYTDKTISFLTNNNVINDIDLERRNDGSGNSVKNTDNKTISQVKGSATFKFNADIGCVTEDSINDVIFDLIGKPPIE